MDENQSKTQLARLESRLERERKTRLEAEAIAEKATSDLYEAQMKLMEAQRRLVQQERLSAIGTMASVVAHDFENLLTPILGYSELLLRSPTRPTDEARTQQYLRSINIAAKDAQSLIDRLRSFYRQRDGSKTFTPTDINQVIEQAIELTRPRQEAAQTAHGADIRIRMDLAPMPPVMGSDSELREVFSNLLINAFDAMPQGGSVIIETRVNGKDGTIRLSDTGVGMPPEVRERCFQPFFTTKGDRGTGLGLAMVQASVRRHTGTIEVTSEVGVGTTFVIRLPVADPVAKVRA